MDLENVLKLNCKLKDLSDTLDELQASDKIKKLIIKSQGEILFAFNKQKFKRCEYFLLEYSSKRILITVSIIFNVNFIQYDLFIKGNEYEIKNIIKGNHYTDDYTKVQTKDKKMIFIKSYDNRKESKVLIQKKFFGYKEDSIYYYIKRNKKGFLVKNIISEEEIFVPIEEEIILRKLLNSLEKIN